MPANIQAKHFYTPYPFGVLSDASQSEQIAHNAMQQGQAPHGHGEKYGADNEDARHQEEEDGGAFMDQRGMKKLRQLLSTKIENFRNLAVRMPRH